MPASGRKADRIKGAAMLRKVIARGVLGLGTFAMVTPAIAEDNVKQQVEDLTKQVNNLTAAIKDQDGRFQKIDEAIAEIRNRLPRQNGNGGGSSISSDIRPP